MIEVRAFRLETVLRLLVLGFLFVAAFSLRLYHIGDPPLDWHEARQYHSALLARGFYEWLLVGELYTFPKDGIMEPPVLELIASFAYSIFGGEYLWIPRLLSAMFWMVGGLFLYLIAKRIISPNAAVFSVFFYLFVPFGVLESRAFMPDPLSVMLLLISIFTILRYHEQPSMRRLVIAAVASSLAVFVKPIMCLFQICGAFFSLAVYRQGVRRASTNPHLLMFMMLSILPTGLYYIYGTYVAGFLQTQTLPNRVVPHFVLEAFFWEGWAEMIGKVVGYAAFVGALLGALLFRAGLPRALMLGLWGGYLLFGLVFTTHIHTHDYYSLQLIPVVALSLGAIGNLVMKQPNRTASANYLSQAGLRYYGRIIVLALFISGSVYSIVEYRQMMLQMADQSAYVHPDASKHNARLVATYQEIGEAVNHSRDTLLLASEYGYALQYHGRLSGHAWPPVSDQRWEEQNLGVQEMSEEERFNYLYSKHAPDYFIVADRYWMKDEEHEALRNFLTENFSIIVQENRYAVFDLREKD